MAQPDYYAEGTTARAHDSKLRVWTKALGVKQNLLGASAKAANNPKRFDTMRVVKLKLLNAFRGTSYGDFGSGGAGSGDGGAPVGGGGEGFANPESGNSFGNPESGNVFGNPEA